MHPPPPLFARTPKKKAASKNAATHPTTTVITALKDKKGSAHAAIKKYIPANYKIDIVKLGPFSFVAVKAKKAAKTWNMSYQ